MMSNITSLDNISIPVSISKEPPRRKPDSLILKLI
jgi:hypothetical protein